MPIGMSDEFSSFDQRAVIKVCGIGGGGGNAVGRMIEAGLKDVEFITVNTDAQALKHSPAGTPLQIGAEITGGLGVDYSFDAGSIGKTQALAFDALAPGGHAAARVVPRRGGQPPGGRGVRPSAAHHHTTPPPPQRPAR